MRLSGPDDDAPPVTDLAGALAARARSGGHRPAVTVLSPAGRQEQGFLSLANWAAKGAHLLELELGLGPGDRLRVDAGPGWPLAAVCVAAWWLGIVVTDADAPAAVVDADRVGAAAGADDVYVLGAGVDGAPLTPGPLEPWTHAVQLFPDVPPTPRAAAGGLARVRQGRATTHAQVLAAARDLGERGVLGVDGSTDLDPVLVTAARPLATGAATLVLSGVDRDAAAGDRPRSWA